MPGQVNDGKLFARNSSLPNGVDSHLFGGASSHVKASRLPLQTQ